MKIELLNFIKKWAPDLKKYNKDCLREFEVDLTDKLVTQARSNDDTFKTLLDCKTSQDVATFFAISDDDAICNEANIPNIRYIAFYCYFTFHRRKLDYNDIDSKLCTFSNDFEGFLSFSHLVIMHEIDKPKYTELSLQEVLNGLEKAYGNIQSINDLSRQNKFIDGKPAVYNIAGVNHAFAELFATYCENYDSFKDNLMNDWCEKAERAIITAQRGNEYAKYHSTHGRILAQKGLYRDALREIDLAIDLENSTSNEAEYALRMIQYQSYRNRIQAHFELDTLKKKQNEINKDLETVKGSLVSNVEIIGFFTGIISFIVASVNIATSMNATEAGVLMVITLGALLTAFGCFSLLLNTARKNIYKCFVVCTGIVLILLGGVTLFCLPTLTALLPQAQSLMKTLCFSTIIC